MDELPTTPGDLTGAQVACLTAIVRAELAWSPKRDLDALVVAELTALGYVVDWPEPVGGPFVTLSAWGAERIGVAIHEHQEIHTSPEGERVWVDVPRWADAKKEPPPVRVPREFGLVELPRPDLIPAPADEPVEPEPELCVDTWTGEPIVLFGRTVPVDRRLKKNAVSGGKVSGVSCSKVKPPIDLQRRNRTAPA